MSVISAGFSERVFEFAFNSEFCNYSRFLLAGCPFIPTQNQEKRLGFDVAIKINNGARFRSLYLQHKVARLVDGKSGSNKKFRDAVDSPYFAFPLDTDQYNLIHRFSQKTRREFYYCAPAFTTRKDLSCYYASRAVVENSAWIDVSKCSPITDKKPHTIVYSSDLKSAARFSEEPDARIIIKKPSVELSFQESDYLSGSKGLFEEYKAFYETLIEWWPERQTKRRKSEPEVDFQMKSTLPTRLDNFESTEEVIEAFSEITGGYLGVSWLVQVLE